MGILVQGGTMFGLPWVGQGRLLLMTTVGGIVILLILLTGHVHIQA